MNIPVLIVGCLTLIALVAHVFGGTSETISIKPKNSDEKKVLSWKQCLCAFQLLAVDISVIAALLFIISLTDLISFEYELTIFISALYFLWGVVWLVQLLWLKSTAKTFFILPQWLFCFVCSGLLYYGA